MSKDKDNKPTEDTAASSKDAATVTSKEKETKENSKVTTATKGAASKLSDDKAVDGKSDAAKSEAATENVSANTVNAEQTMEEAAAAAQNAPQKGDVISDEDDDDDDDDEIETGKQCSTKIEKQILNLIATGHMFKAHTIAKKAYNKDPQNKELAQAYALVLLKTGAVEECRKMIYSIVDLQPQLDEATGNMMLLVEDLRQSKIISEGDPELLSGIGLIFKEAWKYSHHCRDLELSRELYLSSFRRAKTTSTGMNAAWLSWLTGDDAQAKQLAAEVLKLLPPFGLEASFAELIDLAEAQLLLGREDDACKLYEEAMKQRETVNYIAVVTARQQLYFLRDAGFKVPNQALEILVPPTIVVFTGHAIDHPSYQMSLFPPDIENDVKRIITEKLKEIDAKIGYSSASCGADIIFIEALQSLGGEVNIILPFSISDFIETNVRHAGPRWEKRFEKVLASAHSVSFACEDKYLGHDMLYRFSNYVMHGSAVMRGKFLTTEPHLMAVWHSRTS